MMNNNSHQYVYPPPAASLVSMNNTLSTEKINGDNNNNIGELSSNGVPSSGSGGTFNTTTMGGKYYHATTSNNEEREVEERLLREAASSSIVSSTASIIMMNNNNTIDAPQPMMATPMVPLAYQQQPSVDDMAVGFMSTLGGGGGGGVSGGLLPSYQQQHQHQQVQRQEVQQRQAHAHQKHQYQQVQHQPQHQHQQQQQTQHQVQQHNNRLTWRNGEKTFPYKVYDMLEYAVMNGFGHVCSWTVVDDNVDGSEGRGGGGSEGRRGGGSEGGGDAFVIHNRELFTETVLPKFFMHKNWRSFTRQLNIWCFKRTYTNNYTRGVAKSDCYSHPNFKRHQYDQIGLVTRSESKGAFKKDPLTKRRIQVMNDNDDGCIGEITSTAATSSSAAETSSVTINNNTSGSNKRRRSQQDMHEVATFLAGLKSNTATTTSDKERNNTDSIEGEGSQLTLSSPGLHAAAYQDAVLELQQQLQKEEEAVECNVDNNAPPPLASCSQYCSVEPPPEGTLWTCEKCKVAQFVVFDEAVEHERHCTY